MRDVDERYPDRKITLVIDWDELLVVMPFRYAIAGAFFEDVVGDDAKRVAIEHVAHDFGKIASEGELAHDLRFPPEFVQALERNATVRSISSMEKNPRTTVKPCS